MYIKHIIPHREEPYVFGKALHLKQHLDQLDLKKFNAELSNSQFLHLNLVSCSQNSREAIAVDKCVVGGSLPSWLATKIKERL